MQWESMDKREPSVSVLMTAYKGNEHFLPAVLSIMDQTYSDLELVIVLDPHEDDTCKEQVLKISDPRIRLIENRKRVGLVRSRNIGMKACRGRYIAVMDSDDLSRADRLEKEVEFLQRNPDHLLVGSPCDMIDDKGVVIKKGEALPSVEQLYYNLLFANQFPHSSVMFRREVLEMAGGYDEKLTYGEDFDLYLRTMEHGRIHMLPDVMVSWRKYGTSLTSKLTDQMQEDHLRIIKRNIERKLAIDVGKETLELFIDHSIRGRTTEEILSALRVLELINSKFMDGADDRMDADKLKRITRKKFLSLLTGQMISNRNIVSIMVLFKNIRNWPGLILHVLGRW